MKTVDLVIILYPVFYAFVAFEMTFCVPNVIYDCTAGFVFNQSATLRFSVGDSRQVGRIFFKESGKTNLFFFTIFHKLPVLVFLFQCFPFTVVLQISSHPASWSHLFNVDLKSGVVPTRCPFSQKICLFSTRTFSARLDFYGFQLRGSSCYFLVPDGPRFQSENVRSTDCMSSIGHSVARLKTKTAIFEALQ